MAYLIDGNNLLGHISSYSIKDPRSRSLLVRRLLFFQRLKRNRIFLVFDGPPDENLEPLVKERKKFLLLYPARGQKADEIIQEIFSRQSDPKRLCVVTSDRELGAMAKAKRARVLSAKEFNQELRRTLEGSRKARELEKKDKPLTSLETRLWQDLFEGNQ